MAEPVREVVSPQSSEEVEADKKQDAKEDVVKDEPKQEDDDQQEAKEEDVNDEQKQGDELEDDDEDEVEDVEVLPEKSEVDPDLTDIEDEEGNLRKPMIVRLRIKRRRRNQPRTTPSTSTTPTPQGRLSLGSCSNTGVRPANKPKIIPTIIIDHSTNEVCNQLLGNKAQEVKAELQKHIPGIIVKINPESPQKSNGWFQVRTEEDGQILRNYENLDRPYQEVLKLDAHALMLEVRAKINYG